MATKASSSLNILDLATPLGCVDEANAITDRRVWLVLPLVSRQDSRDNSDKWGCDI